MRQIEKANATAAQGSARGHLAHVAEQAGAWGIYHGICRGYKGEHQAEYLREWPRLVALRERVQTLESALRGLHTAELCDVCPHCGPLVMCDAHSRASEALTPPPHGGTV